MISLNMKHKGFSAKHQKFPSIKFRLEALVESFTRLYIIPLVLIYVEVVLQLLLVLFYGTSKFLHESAMFL